MINVNNVDAIKLVADVINGSVKRDLVGNIELIVCKSDEQYGVENAGSEKQIIAICRESKKAKICLDDFELIKSEVKVNDETIVVKIISILSFIKSMYAGDANSAEILLYDDSESGGIILSSAVWVRLREKLLSNIIMSKVHKSHVCMVSSLLNKMKEKEYSKKNMFLVYRILIQMDMYLTSFSEEGLRKKLDSESINDILDRRLSKPKFNESNVSHLLNPLKHAAFDDEIKAMFETLEKKYELYLDIVGGDNAAQNLIKNDYILKIKSEEV